MQRRSCYTCTEVTSSMPTPPPDKQMQKVQNFVHRCCNIYGSLRTAGRLNKPNRQNKSSNRWRHQQWRVQKQTSKSPVRWGSSKRIVLRKAFHFVKMLLIETKLWRCWNCGRDIKTRNPDGEHNSEDAISPNKNFGHVEIAKGILEHAIL